MPRRSLGRQPFLRVIKAEGRTYAGVARRIGITYPHLINAGCGRVAPAPELRERLSEFLDLPEEKLFTPAALRARYVRRHNTAVLEQEGRR